MEHGSHTVFEWHDKDNPSKKEQATPQHQMIRSVCHDRVCLPHDEASQGQCEEGHGAKAQRTPRL